MVPPRSRLDGLRYLKPLRQGDLSNLCGLYSVLNAVQLACWRLPPTSAQLRELLTFGVRHLIKRRLLARVIACGIDPDDWVELASVLVDHSNQILTASLALEPVPLRSSASGSPVLGRTVSSLKRMLHEGHPVLCGFGGALCHYTVLAGYSEHRLTLFDSSGFRWIEERSIGSSERAGKRHWLYADSVRAMVDNW